MTKSLFLTLFLCAGLASASTYTVEVNTGSLSGTTGSLDFQFNPGVGTFQSATADVSNFVGGTYAGSQSIYGTGVSGGPIPSTLVLTNVSGQDNEVLDTYTFANNLTFTLDLSGPAITSPGGADTAGSTFAFSIFSDPAGTVPALGTGPSGIALTINVNDQGALTSSISSPDVMFTPEPSSLALISAPLVLVGLLARRRQR